jgi:hypothetical protein
VVRDGLMGVMGNKGAVSIGFCLLDSNLCFVCSHLASKRPNVEARKSNFDAILAKMSLTSQESQRRPTLQSWHNNGSSKFTFSDMGILDYETVFWLGDLNYHIHQSLTADEVFTQIEAKDWVGLIFSDQLTLERLSSQVFDSFHEAPITFAPTYKVTNFRRYVIYCFVDTKKCMQSSIYIE